MPVANRRAIVFAIRFMAAGVWILFGLGFKVFGLLYRHVEIVAQILGENVAPVATVMVGLAETGLGIWVLSGWRPRMCAAVQTMAIAAMNLFELLYARSLLLAPVPMVCLNIVFLSLIWWAALQDRTQHA